MSDVRIGPLCKFYYNSGVYVTPVWEEVDLISDLVNNSSWERGVSSVRRARVVTNEQLMLNLELTGRVRTDYTNEHYNTLRDAHIDTTTLDILVLNGDINKNGSMGFRFDAKVFDFGEDQALGNVIFNDLAVGPCASDNNPMAAISNGSAVTFSEIGADTA